MGYFDNPTLKRHLKETGVLKRKKRISVRTPKHEEEKHEVFVEGYRTSKTKRGHKHKSLSKSVNTNALKLPEIEQHERGNISSAATTRVKRLYGSKDKDIQKEREGGSLEIK